MTPLAQDIAERFARVRARVRSAAERAGRDPAAVRIIAVTKLHPVEVIEAAYAAGIVCVGENYAQEMVDKLERASCASQLEWHFIGHLQRNKARFLVGRAALIHALDSVATARELDKRMASVADRAGGDGVQRVLLAVNLSHERQKSGVAPGDAATFLAQIQTLEHIRCVGLMTMPPLAHDPEESRPYFRQLAALRQRLHTPEHPLPELSMGTSHDFEVAVEEGATLVRVGTAILGPRP